MASGGWGIQKRLPFPRGAFQRACIFGCFFKHGAQPFQEPTKAEGTRPVPQRTGLLAASSSFLPTTFCTWDVKCDCPDSGQGSGARRRGWGSHRNEGTDSETMQMHARGGELSPGHLGPPGRGQPCPHCCWGPAHAPLVAKYRGPLNLGAGGRLDGLEKVTAMFSFLEGPEDLKRRE